jgi:hypothetical protein
MNATFFMTANAGVPIRANIAELNIDAYPDIGRSKMRFGTELTLLLGLEGFHVIQYSAVRSGIRQTFFGA